MARTGYTLPVFAVAAAKAAFLHLQQPRAPIQAIELNLLPEVVEIPIQQVARLDPDSAVAITISDPGDNLDLTRNTPIWAWVRQISRQSETLILEAGDGLGKTMSGQPAIYHYARQLFDANLAALIPENQTLVVRIILPEGRQLAQRTSNEAFGILEGLSLLGTSGISQPLSAEAHLADLRQILHTKVKNYPHLVFCLGHHGRQVADRYDIPDSVLVQTGNWVGVLLAEAGLHGAQSVLLLGYHGKLIKLAGGIFNTSSHLADAKLEILSAAAIKAGVSLSVAQAILDGPTADAAYHQLAAVGWALPVYQILTQTISQKAQAYVHKYTNIHLVVNTALFDRNGTIISRNIAKHCGYGRLTDES